MPTDGPSLTYYSKLQRSGTLTSVSQLRNKIYKMYIYTRCVCCPSVHLWLRDVKGLVKATTGAAWARSLRWNLRAGRKESVKKEEAPKLWKEGRLPGVP